MYTVYKIKAENVYLSQNEAERSFGNDRKK